jgi:myo-inositol-1(or 4)-monophosphatase
VSIGDYAVGRDANNKNRKRLHLTALLVENVERIRMFGTAALDLAWLAEGRTDRAIILANKPWDTTAGILIAREAGAITTDAHGHPHSLSSGETIVACPGIAEHLLHIVQQAIGEEL